MKARKIPTTDSIDKLARFWDTHDLTDFDDQLENVVEPVFKRASRTAVTIRLHPREAKAVKQAAKKQRVREATLLRRWVQEKLTAAARRERAR